MFERSQGNLLSSYSLEHRQTWSLQHPLTPTPCRVDMNTLGEVGRLGIIGFRDDTIFSNN